MTMRVCACIHCRCLASLRVVVAGLIKLNTHYFHPLLAVARTLSQVRLPAQALRQSILFVAVALEGITRGHSSAAASLAIAVADCAAMVAVGVVVDCADRRAFLRERRLLSVGGGGERARGTGRGRGCGEEWRTE